MIALKITLILLRAWLDGLPGHYTPVAGAAALCALPALLISAPLVWLMTLSLALLIPGMILIGLLAQASLIVPYFLLPERCSGGLEGAISGILALVLLGAALTRLLSLVPLM